MLRKLSEKRMPSAVHKLLEPLAWLQGTWRTEDPASGSYPTIKDFNYCEEISFVSIGQPMFNYTSRSWHPETKRPMHLETGFLKVYEKINNEDSTKVEFILAHNFGLSTIEQGYISEKSIHLKTNGIVTSERSKSPHVTEITREYRLLDDNHLEQVIHMATTNTPTLHKHLLAKYVKVSEET